MKLKHSLNMHCNTHLILTLTRIISNEVEKGKGEDQNNEQYMLSVNFMPGGIIIPSNPWCHLFSQPPHKLSIELSPLSRSKAWTVHDNGRRAWRLWWHCGASSPVYWAVRHSLQVFFIYVALSYKLGKNLLRYRYVCIY